MHYTNLSRDLFLDIFREIFNTLYNEVPTFTEATESSGIAVVQFQVVPTTTILAAAGASFAHVHRIRALLVVLNVKYSRHAGFTEELA